MANYAIVKDNVVLNLVEWDGVTEYSVLEGDLILSDGNAHIGGAYEGGVFSPIPMAEDTGTYAEKRLFEYPSINDLIVALWENVVEERAASVISLEATRQAIKAKYPK